MDAQKQAIDLLKLELTPTEYDFTYSYLGRELGRTPSVYEILEYFYAFDATLYDVYPEPKDLGESE